MVGIWFEISAPPAPTSQLCYDEHTLTGPLRSLDRHDLLVPRSRTATAQHRAYASVGPLLWNDLPAITRAVMLSGGTTVSARSLKTFLFSRGSSHWKRL